MRLTAHGSRRCLILTNACSPGAFLPPAFLPPAASQSCSGPGAPASVMAAQVSALVALAAAYAALLCRVLDVAPLALELAVPGVEGGDRGGAE